MRSKNTDVAIIGAGPYGLSLAAHLRQAGIEHRIFGRPMTTWGEHMPTGMHLKSDGFASSLADPGENYTLEHYSRETGQEYRHLGLPVPLDTFVNYGLTFQQKLVPYLEPVNIVDVKQISDGFSLTTEDGETFSAARVVLAVGITHFAYMPPVVQAAAGSRVSHSAEHHDVTRYRNERVLVAGGGASAIDLAAALADAGAEVHLMARRATIDFHAPPVEHRPLKERVMNPRSGLGLGWRSRMCTDAPLLFHSMPRNLRHRVVQRHLGPAPGWSVRDRVSSVEMHLGATMLDVRESGEQVVVRYQQDGQQRELRTAHMIAGTGYHPLVERLQFVDAALRSNIATADGTAVLNRNFATSVPGLYMVGLASANSFGPLCRFVFGAKFTSKRLSRHLVSRQSRAA